MFLAKFISRNSGISSKTGNPYYQVELIASTLDNGAKVLKAFCSETAYESAAAFSPMDDVKVACGVTSSGHLTVAGIKGANA